LGAANFFAAGPAARNQSLTVSAAESVAALARTIAVFVFCCPMTAKEHVATFQPSLRLENNRRDALSVRGR
jgi:hypothetical protein